ncbi:hypothetical protein Cni_G01248 [Canna indica]|uniref:DDE Tnp4 domain-containing protein n=1 Tax=Canna indica TaxID=4628 RepID=A0AAQ3Q1J4_9LILI|nr:hypothetical protein Cni_G01248 [Canna indica]
MSVEKMVAMFLHICAHHVKNNVIKRQFVRSGETISKQFNAVLNSIILCYEMLLKKPEPVPQNSTDYRWKWFKNCLGALDGTYVRCTVEDFEKPRYRTRKGEIAMNVLGVCSQNMQFIYILPGWEGSAADGYYYLCDARYTNGEGFLIPYRGQRYHLNNWRQNQQPRTPQEFYNYKHSSARNVIERCFGFLKMRWAILRERSFYSVKTHARIISACALLHNHIRREMPIDPFENEMDIDGIGSQGTTQNKIRGKKHQWTPEQDAALIDCMLDLKNDHFWSAGEGNNFKPGFLN